MDSPGPPRRRRSTTAARLKSPNLCHSMIAPELIQPPEQQSVEARGEIVEAEVDEHAAVAFRRVRQPVRDAVRAGTNVFDFVRQRRRARPPRATLGSAIENGPVPPQSRPPEMRRHHIIAWLSTLHEPFDSPPIVEAMVTAVVT